MISNGVHPDGRTIGVSVVFRATEGEKEERMLGALYETLTVRGGFETVMKCREIRRKRKSVKAGHACVVTRYVYVRISLRYRALRGRFAYLALKRPPKEDFAGRMLFDQLVDLLRDTVQHQQGVEGYNEGTGTARALTITFTPAVTPEE
ncbi:hypothetical protein HY629_00730 [Candidatus Uhrbacteria bacterium]|nr:hypothetical protein [Candidatus Uhrbacteria bacterium]